MAADLADSLLDSLLGSTFGPAGRDAANRFTLEGLTCSTKDGAIEVTARSFQATSLRLVSGPFVLEAAKLALDGLVARVRIERGAPRLSALEAAGAELSGVKLQGPLALPAQVAAGDTAGQAPGGWSLGPLAAADGTLRAEIVDAHLLFDADVTVPIRQGRIEFKDATVEHVGPDSRMGVSRLGIHVDAPNGRSYLYQFATSPVAGVEYERRGALPGPWATDRGRVWLQPFMEWLVRQPLAGQGHGLTEQARLLFDRTAVSGEVQLNDGRFASPFAQADLVGRAERRNAVALHSQSVGRGVTVQMTALSARNAVAGSGGTRVACEQLAGALTLQVAADHAQLRFSFDLADMKATGLRLHRGT